MAPKKLEKGYTQLFGYWVKLVQQINKCKDFNANNSLLRR